MRKNIIKLLAILAMCFMVVCMFASCNNNEQPATDDNNNQTQQPSVTPELYIKDGTYWVGDFNTGLPAEEADGDLCPSHDDPNHEWIDVCEHLLHAEDPTQNDIHVYKCPDCGFVRLDVTDGHDHEFVETVDPTCTEDGYDIYVCRCGDVEERNVVEKLGHTVVAFDKNNIAASKANGWEQVPDESGECICEIVPIYVNTCTRCEIDFFGTADPIGHKFNDDEYYPAQRGENVNPCLWVPIKIAQCANCNTLDNLANYPECSHCVDSKEIGKAPGHVWGDWEWVTEPTATEAGKLVRYCEGREGFNCPGVEYFDVAAWNDTDYTYTYKAPTCIATGEHKYVYTKDGQTLGTYTVVVTDKGGHGIDGCEYTWVTKPTKNAAGSVKVTCSICKEELTFTLPQLPALAVNFTKGNYGGYTVTPGTCYNPVDTYEFVLTNGVSGNQVLTGHKITVTFTNEDATLHPHNVHYGTPADQYAGCIEIEKDGKICYVTLCYNDGCKQYIVVGYKEEN